MMGIINEEELLLERQHAELAKKTLVYEEQLNKIKMNRKLLDGRLPAKVLAATSRSMFSPVCALPSSTYFGHALREEPEF